MTRCTRFTCLLALAVLLVAQAATAEIVTTCVFNESNQTLDYSITGGGSGLIYTLSVVEATGPIDLGSPPELTGPDDAAVVAVGCTQAEYYGHLHVDICQGTLCFASYEFDMRSDVSCDLYEAANVPSYSTWSVVGLLILLFAVGVVVIRRRHAMSH